jgi:hypothetical protein
MSKGRTSFIDSFQLSPENVSIGENRRVEDLISIASTNLSGYTAINPLKIVD